VLAHQQEPASFRHSNPNHDANGGEMASTLAEIRRLSPDDLIREHDEVAPRTQVGLNLYITSSATG
jgi:hypothetical protein